MKKLTMKLLILGAVLASGAAILNGCAKSTDDSSTAPTLTLKSSNSQT